MYLCIDVYTRWAKKTPPNYTLIYPEFYSNLVLFSGHCRWDSWRDTCEKSCIRCYWISQILGHFVHFLGHFVTLSYDQTKIYTEGAEFDVYKTVGNQYNMSDNRESHPQTLIPA